MVQWVLFHLLRVLVENVFILSCHFVHIDMDGVIPRLVRDVGIVTGLLEEVTGALILELINAVDRILVSGVE